jgi:hypothetical protein
MERRREEERKFKMDNIWRERVKKAKLQMKEHEVDIRNCATQLENCIGLLMPKPENFLFGQDEKAEIILQTEEEPTNMRKDLTDHGIFDPKMKISLEISAENFDEPKETEDNKEILENLCERQILFSHKLMPMVKKWVVILTKSGENCDSETLKKSIDLKVLLDGIEIKLKPFEKLLLKKRRKVSKNTNDSDDDTDDDDFIEVEDKPGYEETVKAEHHELGIPFYTQISKNHPNQPSGSKKSFPPKKEIANNSNQQKDVFKTTDHCWTIRDSNEDKNDPTTLAATIAKLKAQQKIPVEEKPVVKKVIFENVVKLPYDTDLINWGEERKATKVQVNTDNHRFWGSGANCRDEDMIEVPGSSSRERVIEFSGKFEVSIIV